MELGKRGKNKIQTDFTLKDAHKWYNNQVEEPYKVTEKMYLKIVREFNKKLIDAMLLESEVFHLPARMGYMRIRKGKQYIDYNDSKTNNLAVDWGTSRKLGMRVYHLNKHRDTHIYRFFWDKKHSAIKNKLAYTFKATRTNNRRLGDILKNNRDIDYYE